MTSAAVAVKDRRVHDGKALTLAIVALLAERRPRRYRQLLGFAGMGIMAAETITFGDRRMDDFGIFHQTIVALLAERLPGGDEELGIVAGVRSVAAGTPFVGNNRMDTTHPLGRIVVTTGTKGAAAGDEEFTIFTQMRVMTADATIFQGGMHNFLPLTHAVMALLAEGGAVGGEVKSPFFAGVGNVSGFVAGGTISPGHRVVQGHPFDRVHRCVTFRRHTTLCRSQGERRHRQQADPEQDRCEDLHYQPVSCGTCKTIK